MIFVGVYIYFFFCIFIKLFIDNRYVFFVWFFIYFSKICKVVIVCYYEVINVY